MRVNFVTALVASMFFSMGTGVSVAETSTATLKVKLEVKGGCTVNFDQDDTIDFGILANLEEPIMRRSSFSVRCSNMVGMEGNPLYQSYYVDLGAGANPATAGDTRQRRMVGQNSRNTATVNYLPYEVDQGAGRGKHWGRGPDAIASGMGAVGPNGEGMVIRHDFIVTVPAYPGVKVDRYDDFLQATLIYN